MAFRKDINFLYQNIILMIEISVTGYTNYLWWQTSTLKASQLLSDENCNSWCLPMHTNMLCGYGNNVYHFMLFIYTPWLTFLIVCYLTILYLLFVGRHICHLLPYMHRNKCLCQPFKKLWDTLYLLEECWSINVGKETIIII